MVNPVKNQAIRAYLDFYLDYFGDFSVLIFHFLELFSGIPPLPSLLVLSLAIYSLFEDISLRLSGNHAISTLLLAYTDIDRLFLPALQLFLVFSCSDSLIFCRFQTVCMHFPVIY